MNARSHKLDSQNEDLRASCDACQDKIVDEASTIKSAIRSLHSRFGGMENHVQDLTDDIGMLVQSSRRERPNGNASHRSTESDWKSKERYSSCSTYRRSFAESGDFSYCSQSRSQREGNLNDYADASDLGLRRSLQRIEEVRAKRRRTHFFDE